MTRLQKMGLFIVLFGTVLLVGRLLAPPTATPGLDDAYDRAVLIQAFDPNDNYLWSGSGAILYDQTVATAGHVVSSSYYGTPAKLLIYHKDQVYTTALWMAHDVQDIAIVIVPELYSSMVKLGSSQNVELGTPLYIIGHPAALDSAWVTQGVLSSYSNRDIPLWDDVAGSDAECMGGSSGSGIYTEDGTLVGIVVGKHEDLTFFTDLHYLLEIWK